jgi:hypothetical protein
MERALLQGEREAEWTLLQKEQKAVDQLQEKLVALETGIQKERDKVTHSWLSSVLGTSGPGEKCLPWGPVSLISSSILHTRVSVALQGHRALSSVEGTSLEGAARGWLVFGISSVWIFVLPLGAWVPAISGPSWKCQSPFLGSEPSLRDWGLFRSGSCHEEILSLKCASDA